MFVVRLYIMLLSMAFVVSSSAIAEEIMHIGQAAVVRGEVYVERNTVKHELKARDKVYQGDKVITGDKGKVQIIFADDTIFTVGREAEILLDKYVYDPSTHEGNSEIKAKKGTFKFVTGKIAKKDPKQVRVKTPFATIGVRGSGGIVDVAPTGETTLGLTQCCLDLYSNGNSTPVPLDDLGTFSQVMDPNQPPTPALPMPPEMVQQMNGDLNGGFAPEEGGVEGDEPPMDEGAQNDNPQKQEDQAANDEGGNEDKVADGERKQRRDGEKRLRRGENGEPRMLVEGDQPPLGPDGEPMMEGGNPPPPPEGDMLLTDGTGTMPPPPAGDADTFNFGTFDSATGDDGGFVSLDGGLLEPINSEPILLGEPILQDPILLDSTQQDGQVSTYTTVDNTTFTHSGIFRKRVPGTLFSLDQIGSLSGKYLDTGGFFAEFTSGGKTFSGVLPTTATIGAFGFNSIGFDGKSFSGNGFRTRNGSMMLYNLTDDVTAERLMIATGTRMNATSVAGMTGLTFFNFLPDFLGGNDGVLDFSTLGAGNTGLVVNWNKDLFFGGNFSLDAAGKASLDVAFGNFSGADIANGDIFSLNTGTGIFGKGTIAINDIYGDGNTVDGMLIHSSSLLSTGASTYDINPAIITIPTATDVAKLTDNNQTGLMKGFAAGHMLRDVNGSKQYINLSSGSLNSGNIYVNRNASTGTLNGGFSLTDGTTAVDATFGSVGGGEYADLADTVYAMEQTTMNINGNAVDPGFSGVVVSDVIAEQRCDACQYAHWGVWAATANEANVAGQVDDYQDNVQLIPYIVGELTSNTYMQNVAVGQNLSVNHSGMMFGSLVTNGADIAHHYGNYTLSGKFATGFSFNGDWAGYTLSATGITSGSTAAFGSNALQISQGGGSVATGTLNGAFFGLSASESGGNFSFDTGTQSAAGIFVGSQ